QTLKNPHTFIPIYLSEITSYLDEYKLFDVNQAGFRIDRSTCTQLYFINGISLTVSPFMKDLGVIMHPSLKFTDHVSKMTSKARAKVNLMFKSFFSSDRNLYSRAYSTFIRPLLEYGSVIWSPHTVTLANQIEAVQRNFSLRLFTRCRIPYSLYPDRINQLSLQTLEHRRFISDLLFLHKSVLGFYSYDHSNLFKLPPLPVVSVEPTLCASHCHLSRQPRLSISAPTSLFPLYHSLLILFYASNLQSPDLLLSPKPHPPNRIATKTTDLHRTMSKNIRHSLSLSTHPGG
ncbi:hypothetical protein PRIPAC_85910, partial [Pristionchus pacificus]|uniref:Uncharacterized protein n=1 Tax=Pristionchus pacificus TaxID=54126 RepID=A0A2A6BLS9_PRIPA